MYYQIYYSSLIYVNTKKSCWHTNKLVLETPKSKTEKQIREWFSKKFPDDRFVGVEKFKPDYKMV